MSSSGWVCIVKERKKEEILREDHIMGSVVEEKIKTGALVNGGTQATLLEEMKLLKEMQDQSGLFFFIKTWTIFFLLCLVFEIVSYSRVKMGQLTLSF